MTRTTNNARSNLHTRRGTDPPPGKQAAANFEDAKAKFAAAFATNPKYAIEWCADQVARAQTHYEFWIARRGGARAAAGWQNALQYASERGDREVDSFFGTNSTCPWTNALRRIEAEVYNALARRDLRELQSLAAEAA